MSFVDEGLGNTSYLLDVGDGRAVVVDPRRDVTPYLMAAERSGLTIAFSLETHLHADFLTGSRELAAHGASVLASRAAELEWPHRGFADGDEVDLGGLRVQALATPGHTPEHLSWLVRDGGRPVALFSGGALLTGAVARTDLIAPDRTEALARALWRSLQESILTLPDDLPVYPTHGPGSFCTAPTDGARTTTIGRERAANALLAAPDEDAFVAAVLDGYGSYPPYFLRLRERNRVGPAILGSPFPPLPALAVDEVRRRLDGGAVLVDARPVRAWAAGHVPGAFSIPLRPQFASWLGWLVDDDQPLVFVLDPDQDGSELVRQARTIGYEQLVGVLAGGVDAWRAEGLPVAVTEVVPAASVDGPVVDVRQASEHAAGHLPGAVHVELGDLSGQISALPPGRLATMCGHGERAATAASVLERAGRDGVAVVLGGPTDWAVGGRRLATGS
ncbi:MAG TPA: rhodanese-like domain-containing protein [Acidimicrobiales bacterium]|nr:rhodanese-like domain-containing protein [Acidimicrobiales bacterium]